MAEILLVIALFASLYGYLNQALRTSPIYNCRKSIAKKVLCIQMVNALLQVTVIEATVVWNRSLATIGKLEELIANKLRGSA